MRGLFSTLALFFLLGAPVLRAADLSVFAAASLMDALTEIASTYGRDSSDRIFFNFAASSILARQIEEGAGADLFISADESKLDHLEAESLIDPQTRTRLLSNTLVVVAPGDSERVIRSPRDLLSVQRIALAEPRTVPAGIYARQYLESIGLWDQLKSKIIPTQNVRAALASVEAGNVDAAIVYATDAAISKKAEVAFNVPADQGPEITYAAAVITDARHPLQASAFLAYLKSEAAMKIFEKHGFITVAQ